MKLWELIKRSMKIGCLSESHDHRAQPGTPMLYQDFTCSAPSSFLIDAGNLCNLKCPFCQTGAGTSRRTKGIMSLDRFNLIYDKVAPSAKMIGLYNWGEPFLNKDIVPMISLIAAKGIYSYLSSNLSLPDLDHESIVRSGLALLIAAVDGTTQDSYEKYRQGGDLQLAFHNIKQLQEAKRRLHRCNPHIIWRFCVNKYNEHELDAANKIAAYLGVEIMIEYMTVWEPSWESDMRRNNKDIPDTLRRNDAGKYNKADRSLPIPIDEMVLHPNLLSNVCTQAYNMMVINWDGDVYPCCMICDTDAVLGNLLENDMLELWNNEKYRKCREYLFYYGIKQNARSACEAVRCSLIRSSEKQVEACG